jgi:hypothetical protein
MRTGKRALRILCFTACAILSLAGFVRADLKHRYVFDTDATDQIGTLNGTVTSNSVYTVAPDYVVASPPGTVESAPDRALSVGAESGSKKSGVTISRNAFGASGTLAFWFRPDGSAFGRYIANAGLQNGFALLQLSSTNTVRAGVIGAENSSVDLSYTGTDTDWHFFALCWDTVSGSATVFLDDDSHSFSFTPGNWKPIDIRLGAYSLADNANNLDNQFDGLLWDVQMYDEMLAPEQIGALRSSPGDQIPNRAKPVHRYVFDGHVRDVLGGRDGSPTGSGIYTEPPHYSVDIPAGAASGGPYKSLETGMNYGSKKSGFSIHPEVINTNAGSYCFWMKADVLENGRYIFAPLPLTDGPFVMATSSSQISVTAGDDRVSLPAPVSTGTWHHVAVTWNNPGGTFSLYMDGLLTGSTHFTTNGITPTTVRVGSFNLTDDDGQLSNQFEGKLYDLQIYEGVLTGDEIASLYLRPGGVAVPEPPIETQPILSNGEILVATAVVTNAPYLADPSGTQDSGPAIQSAIDVTASLGGGAVFVPPGVYRIDGTLSLGYGVTLQGAGGSLDGTVLLATAGRGDTNAAPFISAASTEVGMIDLCIYYPEQVPTDIWSYPPTIRTQGAATLRNILLCNSYSGIRLELFNASILEKISGTVLKQGVSVPLSTEFAWMRDVDFSNAYWEQAVEALEAAPMSAAQREAVGSYTRQNLIGLEQQRLDGLVIDGFHADDAMLPVYMHPYPETPWVCFGGVVSRFPDARREEGVAPWYAGMHYANLDNVPEAQGKQYEISAVPQPARTDVFIDVTRSPYAARGDGMADDTYAIRQALAYAGSLGGGTVYLPQGTYKVTAPLTVPDGVELRGIMGTGKVREARGICTIASTYGHNTANPLTDTALITLGNHAGVRGFSILHPLQPYDVSQIKPYPYDIRGNGSNCWIVDMMLVNAWFGIDLAANRNDNFLVRDLWATAYHKGIDVGGGSVGGRLERLAFSGGPLAESVWYTDQKTTQARDALFEFIKNNSIYYSFGASSNLTAWGLVGFLPDIQCRFYEQNGESTQHAEFWMSLFDVAGTFTIKAEQGSEVDWYGFFATSWGYLNWLNVDAAFQGPMRFYAKTIHQPHQTSAFTFTEPQIRFFDEVSLITGKAASADRTASGSSPANAVDRNSRTFWEAPSGSVLEVDLGAVMNINRFDVESVLFEDRSQIITRAELHVSTDGVNFVPVATNSTSDYYWMSMPVEKTPARYARLVAQSGAATLKVAGFNLFNTSATVRPVAGMSPIDPFTLRWASWPGHTYSVWHTASLTSGFTKIADGIGGSGATLEFTDPVAHQHKAAFYQLKVRSEE